MAKTALPAGKGTRALDPAVKKNTETVRSQHTKMFDPKRNRASSTAPL
jgi:hypothetical protein